MWWEVKKVDLELSLCELIISDTLCDEKVGSIIKILQDCFKHMETLVSLKELIIWNFSWNINI